MTNALPNGLENAKTRYTGWLDPLVGSRVFWQQSPEGAELPLIVLSAADPGREQPYIGRILWTGRLTARAFATTEEAAETLAAQIVAAIPATHTVSTVTVTSHPIGQTPPTQGEAGHSAGWRFASTVEEEA